MATCRTGLRKRCVVVVVCSALLTATAVVGGAANAAAEPCTSWPVGAIAAKYDSIGGASSPLGCAQFAGERTTPDGAGRYTHFAGGSIYWTSGTGAHVVWGAIRDRWSALGWEQSPLGYPVSDETRTPDGAGAYNVFQNGSIYWSGVTGAHEVRGAIRDKWAALGWERNAVGYPVSDETRTPDGAGAYNVFQNGSIYWSGVTGAHEVRGAIRDAWASLGWERGDLGYPTSDEIDAADGTGRLGEFQNGRIYWANGDTCTVNSDDIPVEHSGAQQYASEAGRRRCGEIWRQVSDLIVGGRYAPHSRTDIEFRVCGDCPGLAWVVGTGLFVGSGYINSFPDDVGLLAHELAHVAQSYPNGLGWGTEGIADWVRYALGLPPPGHGTAMTCQGGHHYSEGYECAATFLDYLDRRDPGELIRDLNAYGHAGSADIDGWLAGRFGRSVGDLWNDCRGSQCAGGRAYLAAASAAAVRVSSAAA